MHKRPFKYYTSVAYKLRLHVAVQMYKRRKTMSKDEAKINIAKAIISKQYHLTGHGKSSSKPENKYKW